MSTAYNIAVYVGRGSLSEKGQMLRIFSDNIPLTATSDQLAHDGRELQDR